MKSDNYTKIVLTIIAVNLTVFTFRTLNIIPTVEASTKKLDTRSYGLVPVNPDGSINVKLKQDNVVNVQLVGIDESSYLRWEAIKVKSDN
ncbi:hypothetical protein [Mucilaginibacter lappiensis]|uniref:hypothetical protein n=1 Tax=Mucilaginibacter lappiensis TaxID=354630 RepID=UPI003D21B29F